MPAPCQMRTAAAVIGLLTFTFASPAHAHTYTITTIDIPGQAITQTTGNPGALNDHGQLVGSTFSRPSTYQGFIARHGSVTLTQTCDILAAINNNGLAVGYTQSGGGYCTVGAATGKTSSYTVHSNGGSFRIVGIDSSGLAAAQITRRNEVAIGLLLNRNHTTVLQAPGSMNRYGGTYPTGLNDAATIVGYYSDAATYVHGFTYAAGAYTSFDYPGSTGTYPYFITPSGDLGGGYLPSGHGGTTLGFVRIAGAYTQILPAGAVGSFVEGIGPNGEIVGSYIDSASTTHGFIDRDGTIQTIDVPSATRTVITSINAQGTLAGNWQDTDGIQHAFTAR